MSWSGGCTHTRRLIPFRERPRAQLMLALYRCGRQAEALETYRSYQELLDRDLGVAPSQMLRDRQTEILRQSLSLDRRAATGPGPGRRTRPAPSRSDRLRRRHRSVPPELTSFVGREQDVAEVVAAIAESRLVTLTGVGGVGKTRLAMRAAVASGPFTDGSAWCELAPVTDPSAVAAAVATALGVRRSAETSVVESLVDYLSQRQMLLVLDNCEHLRGGVRPLVESLLRGCPRLVVLATSRARLAVDRRARPPRRAAAGARAIGTTGPDDPRGRPVRAARLARCVRTLRLDEDDLDPGRRHLPTAGRPPAGPRAGRRPAPVPQPDRPAGPYAYAASTSGRHRRPTTAAGTPPCGPSSTGPTSC